MNEIKKTLQQDADALLKRLQQSRKNGTGVTLSVSDVGVLCEEIDLLKAQQKLNKPARVGGAVFREGVAWKTVIECAQRHYDYGQRDTQPTPLISPSDAIKLASGELVLVPKEFDPMLAEKMAFECLPRPAKENDLTWIEIAENAYQDNLKLKKFEILRTYKELIEKVQGEES